MNNFPTDVDAGKFLQVNDFPTELEEDGKFAQVSNFYTDVDAGNFSQVTNFSTDERGLKEMENLFR